MIFRQGRGQGRRRRRVWGIGLGRQPERMWPTKRAALNIINLELFPRKIDNDGLNRNKESSNSSSSIWGKDAVREREIGGKGEGDRPRHRELQPASGVLCCAIVYKVAISNMSASKMLRRFRVSSGSTCYCCCALSVCVCFCVCVFTVCECECASNRNADPWVDAANCEIILKLSSWMVICLMAALIGHCQKFSSAIGWQRDARGREEWRGGADCSLSARSQSRRTCDTRSDSLAPIPLPAEGLLGLRQAVAAAVGPFCLGRGRLPFL